jgi:hypothetical protein
MKFIQINDNQSEQASLLPAPNSRRCFGKQVLERLNKRRLESWWLERWWLERWRCTRTKFKMRLVLDGLDKSRLVTWSLERWRHTRTEF